MDAHARVTVIAPTFTREIATWARLSKVEQAARKFEPGDLSGARLVIAATSNSNLNRLISELAEHAGILVNVVDDPASSRFITPAIVKRSPVTIAISSAGMAPVLSRMIRQKIETLIPISYGRLAAFAGKFRGLVKEQLHSLTARRLFWEHTFEGPVAHQVLHGQKDKAKKLFDEQLANHADAQTQLKGEVFLIGAGPGDPELLTLKALRLMQQADVVFYDNLVSRQILELVRRDALKIPVGKMKGNHIRKQDDINKDLIRLAKEGNRVCRLKGGDPFIFGRGGEEVEALVEASVLFQIVPGISAASGCSTYAGIPLTHRDYADHVMFLTGHGRNNGDLGLSWLNLTNDRLTLVFYMGLGHLESICKKLQENGIAKDTPAAAIERGTSTNQRTLLSSVDNLSADVEVCGFESPTLIIVGQVVKLSEKCHWFGDTPIQYSRACRGAAAPLRYPAKRAS